MKDRKRKDGLIEREAQSECVRVGIERLGIGEVFKIVQPTFFPLKRYVKKTQPITTIERLASRERLSKKHKTFIICIHIYHSICNNNWTFIVLTLSRRFWRLIFNIVQPNFEPCLERSF